MRLEPELQLTRKVVRRWGLRFDRERKMIEFILQWNVQAHPFRWSTSFFDNVRARVDPQLAIAA